MATQPVINRNRQKGAALLAFIMIFIVASAYSLTKKLNSNTIDQQRRASSLNNLNKAKAALIGYAVNYPLDHPGVGPGRLPCPDTNDNGSAAGNCTGATTGRFPYKTLEVEDLRDQFGQRLWYRVANNYRSYTVNPPVVNSDTAGNFSVDGNTDIVAVIFAPGSPVATQDRAADSLDVANYLEDDNADAGDAFVTRPTLNPNNEFNDTLVAITRQELMSAVEKRVLGDVDEALSNYQTDSSSYPWLSAFSDPAASTFRGTVNTWQGHLPFHWAADPDSIEQGGAVAGRNPFTTDPTITGASNVQWNIASNDTLPAPDGIITDDCLYRIDCNDGTFPVLTELNINSNFECTWSDRLTANCSTITGTNSAFVFINLWPVRICFGTITRTYTIDFPEFVNEGVFASTAPTSSTVRTRDVSLDTTQAISDQVGAITITDVFNQLFALGLGCDDYNGTRTLNFVNATGTLAINGIQYDLSIDDDELPIWFVENEWHELTYLTYAADEPLPGNTTAGQDCNSLGTCLSVNINGSTNSNVRAAALAAGITLTGQDRVTTPDANDYYDDAENTDSDEVFLKSRVTTTYNDQTRIISTAP